MAHLVKLCGRPPAALLGPGRNEEGRMVAVNEVIPGRGARSFIHRWDSPRGEASLRGQAPPAARNCRNNLCPILLLSTDLLARCAACTWFQTVYMYIHFL